MACIISPHGWISPQSCSSLGFNATPHSQYKAQAWSCPTVSWAAKSKMQGDAQAIIGCTGCIVCIGWISPSAEVTKVGSDLDWTIPKGSDLRQANYTGKWLARQVAGQGADDPEISSKFPQRSQSCVAMCGEGPDPSDSQGLAVQ